MSIESNQILSLPLSPHLPWVRQLCE